MYALCCTRLLLYPDSFAVGVVVGDGAVGKVCARIQTIARRLSSNNVLVVDLSFDILHNKCFPSTSPHLHISSAFSLSFQGEYIPTGAIKQLLSLEWTIDDSILSLRQLLCERYD
jgi:hypothetical protein